MLKHFLKILARIGEWPEKARRLAAWAAIIMAAFLLFSLWEAAVSSRLNLISQNPPSAAEPVSQIRPAKELETKEFPGIIESLARGFADGLTLIKEGGERIWKYGYDYIR